MVDVNSVLNTTELTQQLSVYILDKLSPLITIFKVVGIVILIYIIFLIVRAWFRWKTAYNIGEISRNVEQINEKLDILVGKKAKPGKEKEKKKK